MTKRPRSVEKRLAASPAFLSFLPALATAGPAWDDAFERPVVNGQAVSTDPTAAAFNPAGLSFVEGSQAAAQAIVATSTITFSANANTNLQGGNGGDAGTTEVLPGFYFAQEVTDDRGIGFSFNSPFGGELDYSDGWSGRYVVQDIDFDVYAFGGSAGYQVTDWLSVGALAGGIYATFEQSLAINTPGFRDGQAKTDTDGWDFAFKVGAMVNPIPPLKIGVVYHSEVDLELDGSFQTSFAPGAPMRAVGNRTPDLPMDRQIHGTAGLAWHPTDWLNFALAYEFVDLGDAGFDVTGAGGGRVAGDYSTNQAHLVILQGGVAF